MTAKADKSLLKAVLEPRQPGAMQTISDAIAAGADPNAQTPDTSTSMGHVPKGRTLLTHAIFEDASRVVFKLLDGGADPSLKDALGWTPWMASTMADERKRGRIQAALEEVGADKSGESVGQLIRAVYAGDMSAVRSLQPTAEEFEAMSHFRVDLVGHQISSKNFDMLDFLLDSGMASSSTNFVNAVRFGNTEAVRILLQHGRPPESSDDGETPLMTAANLGNQEIVELLVEAGADVSRYSDENGEWTPSQYATAGGHKEVAEWLTARMSESALARKTALEADRNPKFQALYDHGTAAEGLTTDGIVAVLEAWDEKFGVSIDEATEDSVRLCFERAPDDAKTFVREALALCPDLEEDREQLFSRLTKDKMLFLWWD